MPAKTTKKTSSRAKEAVDLEALPPEQRAAHEILAQRADLAPSVERILSAGLPDDDTVRALELFRGALDQPGDPHRDPRVAIEAATSTPSTTSA